MLNNKCRKCGHTFKTEEPVAICEKCGGQCNVHTSVFADLAVFAVPAIVLVIFLATLAGTPGGIWNPTPIHTHGSD